MEEGWWKREEGRWKKLDVRVNKEDAPMSVMAHPLYVGRKGYLLKAGR
jgi:hypothetical protein